MSMRSPVISNNHIKLINVSKYTDMRKFRHINVFPYSMCLNLRLSTYSNTLINLMWLLLVTGEPIDISTNY